MSVSSTIRASKVSTTKRRDCQRRFLRRSHFRATSQRSEYLSSDSGRRDVLTAGLAAVLATQIDSFCRPRNAEAYLVMVPTAQLNNEYYLLRAGQSQSEAEGFVDTNPVNKGSMTNGLSEAGKRQILRETIPKLKEMEVCTESCWLWPSTTQNSYETAVLIAYAFGLGQERIVPEYSFLDMRGLGIYDQTVPDEAYANIHEIDSQGATLRPPPTTTGTPNESVADVFVRVRQLISILETLYLGSKIVVISPDSENLSILQAAILGGPNSEHWQRSFLPGEIRRLELAETEPERRSFSMDCPKPPNCV